MYLLCTVLCVVLCVHPHVNFVCISCTLLMQEGRTPLMAAVQENRTAAIQILINEGKCDRNATNNVCAFLVCVTQINVYISCH